MADRYWVQTAGGDWDATAGTKWSTTSGGAGGASVPTAADDVYFDANSGANTVTVTASATCQNLSFTSGAGNFTGTFAGTSALAISGNLILAPAMTRSYTGAITFNSTTNQNITSNNTTLNSAVTFNGVGGKWTFIDDFVTGTAATTTLTNGTLEISAAKKLSTGLFSSTNSNTRAIIFGAGAFIELTGVSTSGTITIWNVQTATGMTYTGTTDVRLTGNSTANARAIGNGNTAGGSAATAVSFTITAGSDQVFTSQNSHIQNLIFTSFTGSLSNNVRNFYGNITFSSGMTVTGTGVQNLIASAGSQTITTNGVTFDFPITITAPSSTITFADDFTQGSSRIFWLVSGNLNINGKTASIGNFYSYASASRSINFGNGGKIVVNASGSAAWSVDGSNLTTSGTNAVISMVSASAKSFGGNGYNYAATLDQGGAGTLTISGSNTFQNITNTYGATGATTITFTAGTTQTVSQFTASGTVGKLLTLNSSSAGTRFTLSDSSGANALSYCSIKDCIATGGAAWGAYTTSGNVDSGNNLGWAFTQPENSAGNTGLSVGLGLGVC